jgi:DNA mismatch endonuclease (patch repair protein)
MRGIRQSNTYPELSVRRLAHALGYRFRLHKKELPGSPDIIFTSRRKIIFVHGCFWHRHPGCSKATVPKTRENFWREKFSANIKRDTRAIRKLRALGWKVLVIWECETKDEARLARKLTSFLE